MNTKAAWALAGGAGLAVALIVACSGGSNSQAACNAGETRQCVGAGGCTGGQVCNGAAWSACDCGSGGDSGGDTGAPSDGGADGTAPGPDITPYLNKCSQLDGGAPMVNMGSFCVDTREATADEVKLVAAGNVAAPECTGSQPPACKNADRAVGAMPADCITWCKAAGHCEAVGKRLCSSQEMRAACVDPSDFPWGQDVDASSVACFGQTIAPAGQSKCHSPIVPQYFVDGIVGGVREWLSTPKQYTQYGIGADLKPGDVCGAPAPLAPSALLELPSLGFRCCADPK